MILYVARHGQTQWNLEYKVCGSTDLPLTEEGLRQADVLAEKVVQVKPDVIISSTMIRAMQTAQASCNACGLELITDNRIVEQDFGTYEGIGRFDPEFKTKRRNFAYVFPQGESMMRMGHRVYSFLDDIREKYADKTVVVVCHGSVARMMRTYFISMENEEYFGYLPENAELVKYEIGPRGK